MTDADLVRGARGGDAEAWRSLYQRHLPAVWRQAYALVADVHVAEDITSETMLALLKGIASLEQDGSSVASLAADGHAVQSGRPSSPGVSRAG